MNKKILRKDPLPTIVYMKFIYCCIFKIWTYEEAFFAQKIKDAWKSSLVLTLWYVYFPCEREK